MKVRMNLMIFLIVTCLSWTATAAICTAYCITEAEATSTFELYKRLEPSKIWALQRGRQVSEAGYLSFALQKCDDLIQRILPEKEDSNRNIVVQFNENGELIPATTGNSCR